MLVPRIVSAAGLVASLALVPPPALASEPVSVEPGATPAVIRRIPPTPPVGARPATPDEAFRPALPPPTPLADRAHGPLERRLDLQAQDLATLRLQVSALRRTLEILLAGGDREAPRRCGEPGLAPSAPAR